MSWLSPDRSTDYRGAVYQVAGGFSTVNEAIAASDGAVMKGAY